MLAHASFLKLYFPYIVYVYRVYCLILAEKFSLFIVRFIAASLINEGWELLITHVVKVGMLESCLS